MQPILWTERPTGALVVGAGALWPKLCTGVGLVVTFALTRLILVWPFFKIHFPQLAGT